MVMMGAECNVSVVMYASMNNIQTTTVNTDWLWWYNCIIPLFIWLKNWIPTTHAINITGGVGICFTMVYRCFKLYLSLGGKPIRWKSMQIWFQQINMHQMLPGLIWADIIM